MRTNSALQTQLQTQLQLQQQQQLLQQSQLQQPETNSPDESEDSYSCLACNLTLTTNDNRQLNNNEVAELWKQHIKSREHAQSVRAYVRDRNCNNDLMVKVSEQLTRNLMEQSAGHYFCHHCLKLLKTHGGWQRHLNCQSHLRNVAATA